MSRPLGKVDRMIRCVYCGGEHARPAEVKQCWADRQAGAVAPPPAERSPQRAAKPAKPAGPAAPPSVDRGRAAEEPGTDLRAETRTARSPSGELAPTQMIAARRGPPHLGRHVIVTPGVEAPEPWRDCDRVAVDVSGAASVDATLGPALDAIRVATNVGTSLVLEIDATVDEATPPEAVDERPTHVLGVEHAFAVDELWHLVWSNSIDLRLGSPRWALVDRAVAAGASVIDAGDPDAAGDVDAPGIGPVWLDGGPIRHSDPVDGVAVLHAVQIEHGRWSVPAANATDADLAADQLAAVTHDGGAARIIAPAGSGKTRVLTERARHLVDVWKVPASALTLVAFNKRAQEEMRARTSDLPGVQVRTLNSIALAIVNGTPPFAPQPRRWRTIDEPDVRRVLQRFVSTPRRRNTDPIAPWLDALSLVRLGLVDPVEVEARYGGDVDGLAEVYSQFVAALEGDGAVDFDGQIHRALTVLLTQPAARRVAQRSNRIVLVDEFQDLTPAHLLMIRLLAAPGGAVFGVGDDDQTIYGYNGADPAWLIEFGRWFPGAGDHPLEVNYRCPAGVVDAADRLVRHNRRRVDKTIRAASTDPSGWDAVRGDDPVGRTVERVRALVASGVTTADVAVLTRVNATIAPVQIALTEAGLGFSGGVGTEFADRTAIRAALAWLRLASGRSFGEDDLGEALRRPSRPLHPRIADWVREQRDVDALERLADRLTNERDADRLREFAADVAALQRLVASGAVTATVVDHLLVEIGLGTAVSTLDASRRGMNRAAQGDDLTALAQLARLQPAVATFERWLRDRLAVRRDEAGVTLATVHRVKGQEWPHVVVHLADDDQFPHRLADDHEEERRLFHVAVTRAAASLTVVSGGSPSPFVAELTTEPPEHPPELPPAPRSERQRSSTSGRGRTSSDHPLLDRSRVMAVPGLVLVDQGHEWTIVSLEPDAAVAERDGATRRFALGAKVETVGRQRGALGPRPGDVDEPSALLFDALRSFRDRVRDGKPAYTVFDDKTLAAIATALPADTAELARVKGVGPAKLEQYGDDVLSLTASIRPT